MLPPPAPGVPPRPPVAGPAEPATPPRRRTTSTGLAVAAAAVLAGTSGVLVGFALDDGAGDDRDLAVVDTDAVVVADPAGGLDVRGVVDAVGPSVVTISADIEGFRVGEAVGTGVIVSGDGEVLTNAHVVAGASDIRVRLPGDTEPTDAELLASDAGNDLALLRVDAADLPAVEFSPAGETDIGDEVLAIGFALDLDGAPSVTLGIISALDRTILTELGALDRLIQTDAAISSGNSGGPLVDAAGRVVGINTAVARSDGSTAVNSVSFAISSEEVEQVLSTLRERAGGDARIEGFLGVGLDERTDGGQGALVTRVERRSPAADAGLLEGDVIVSVDDSTTAGAAGVIAAIRDREPGDQIDVIVVRQGEEQSVTVTLAERPAEPED